MFEARLLEAQILKQVVEAVRELVTDANLECSESEVEIQAMDSSHVSLVSLKLRAELFDMLRCDRTVSLGLNLVNLGKILKCANNSDTVTLKAEEDDEKLSLAFENESQDRISEFDLRLMDIDSEQLGIPDTQYRCVVQMPSAEFQRIIRDISVVGDTVRISCTKEGICFSVEGDIGAGSIMLRETDDVDKKEDEQVSINMEEPVSLQFAQRYLSNFTKATPLSSTVTLKMSPDIPIVVEYPISDGGHVQFYLAPKIDDEEGAA